MKTNYALWLAIFSWVNLTVLIWLAISGMIELSALTGFSAVIFLVVAIFSSAIVAAKKNSEKK